MNLPSRSVLVAALETCVGMIRFRKGPEDLPVSRMLLVAAVTGGVLLRVAMLGVSDISVDNPVPVIAISTGAPLLFLMVMLRIAGHPERFTQTATAIFGAQIVLAPVLLGSAWFLLRYLQDPVWQGPALLVRSAVEVWVLVVAARILRSATGWPLFACVALAIAAELLTWMVIASLLPAQPAVATPTPA